MRLAASASADKTIFAVPCERDLTIKAELKNTHNL